MSEEAGNQFKIDTVQAVASDESMVTGTVVTGLLRKGSWIAFATDDGTPITGQICRIGDVKAPLNQLREGDSSTLVLGVEEKHLKPGMVVTTQEEGTFAPTMIVTEMAPAARGDLEVRPKELVDIEIQINQRRYREALEALEKYHAGQKMVFIVQQLTARIHLESEPVDVEHDTKKALQLIRDAYDGFGKSDADVLETMARALGENGEPISGLRYLDRLFAYAMDLDSREYYQTKIIAHRRRYNIRDKWEVLDATGDVIFSTERESELVENNDEDPYPNGCQVRKNRIGELVDIDDFVRGNGAPKTATSFWAKIFPWLRK
jgi:ribosomal protein L22